MKIILLFLMLFCFSCSTTLSQTKRSDPDMQPSARQVKIMYNGKKIFKVYRALEGSRNLQLIRIFPGAAFIPMYDCGWRKTCPYVLYVFTDDQLTSKIKLEPQKTYHIFYDPRKGWQIEEYLYRTN